MKRENLAVQRLALDLKRNGFSKEAKKLSSLLLKKAFKIDVDFLNQVRDDLGDSILEMEYYPPGAGLFPESQEIGIFFQSPEKEMELREKLKDLNFDFKGLITHDFFAGTISGSTSAAVGNLTEPYYVIIATSK
jgi:hypothetical protein